MWFAFVALLLFFPFLTGIYVMIRYAKDGDLSNVKGWSIVAAGLISIVTYAYGLEHILQPALNSEPDRIMGIATSVLIIFTLIAAYVRENKQIAKKERLQELELENSILKRKVKELESRE